MNVHIVVECWGSSPGDHGYSVFQDRTKSEKYWEHLIHEYLDGSDRDADQLIERAKQQGFVFHHSDGFISITTETIS